jgi:putative peptidoglycan lipid II flippase
MGVALGSVFMVLAQVRSFARRVGFPRRLGATGRLLTLGAFAPIAVYTLARQAQVFVERFLGSTLPPGTISHLNYAQKVAQVPMLVALLLCTVTFPTLARDVAAGQVAQAARRLRTDLRAVTGLILVAAAYLVAFAPLVVQVLLQHGLFTAADTAATAAIMRMYALGLLGQALVGVLCRPYFTGGGRRPGWYPATAMGAGLAVTAAVAVAAAPRFGGPAIAAANAAGITVTAALLLLGLRRSAVRLSLSTVAFDTVRLAGAAAGAGCAGWLAGGLLAGLPSIVDLAVGGIVVLAAFAVLTRLMKGGWPWRWC